MRQISSRSVATGVVHLIFIVIIFLLPELLMRYASSRFGGSMPLWVYAKSGVMIGVFYLNYFVIIQRTIIRRQQWWRFVLWNVLLISAAALLMWWLFETCRTPRPHEVVRPENHRMVMWLSFVVRDAVMLVLCVSLAVALRLSGRWLDLERRRVQLVAEKRESELQSLRSQLNPHFLFNVLNSIYALIEISPAEAKRAVHELSELLRYVVYDNPTTVPLEREVAVIHNYVELMRLRLGDRPVRVDIDCPEADEVRVPPLVCVTLIENAFKHGTRGPGREPIDITLQADRSHLRCTTVNGVDPGDAAREPAGGVGLANLHRRLELLYGRRARLTTAVADGRYTATLTIDDPCVTAD